MVVAGADVAERKVEPRGVNTKRRQQVIDAAAAIFSQHGYHGASTRAIADHLNIKVASLYFHIESKEDALEEICTLGVQRALTYLDKALADGASLTDQLRLFFLHEREDLAAHADYVSVSIHEGRHLQAEAQKRIGKLTRELRARFDQMLQAAQAAGQLAPGVSPRQARFVLIGTLRSISEIYANARARNVDEILSVWTEVVIRGLVANYSPPPPSS